MSLLMKALEKAAKEREETEAERTPATVSPSAATDARSELSLEPLPAGGSPPRETPGIPREPGLAPRRPGRRAGEASLAAAADAAQAANMLRAGDRASGGVGAYLRDHPIVVFGALASLFLIGYGLYVYLQMTNPGMFIAQPRPTQPAQITPPPASAPIASGGGAASAQQPLSTSLLLPPRTDAGGRDPAPQPPGVAAGTAATAPASAGTAAAEKGTAAGTAAAGAPAAGTAASNPALAAPPAPPVPARSAPREDIRVARGSPPPTLNPVLAGAYQALESGNLDSSERLYNQVLKGEPSNVDALLGGAAVAAQKGDAETAARNYMKVLQVDPGNTLAQAGLIGMVGRADPLAAETRVKQLIARDPSAYLYFTLGNVYVDQNRWPDAQQAYFQAHHLQPDNPDYAYNLAVGLEHVGQPKLALEFYRRATQLASVKGRANFSTGAALERISQLERVVQ